jgi:tartrate dehydrogenase/decarboxylase/D-malate dehydrogenase
MMLQHLGHQDAHDMIVKAIEDVLRDGSSLTRDMGGNADTKDLTAAILGAL